MISPKTVLAARNIRPSKKMGQNFLKEPGIAEKIVAAADIHPDDIVVEIGAGIGSLTVPLAQSAKKVVAYEKDFRLIQTLKEIIQRETSGEVMIVNEDFLKFDAASFYQTHRQSFVVAGNLPYNISSQALLVLIANRAYIRRAVLMFQQELADRLTASPGNKAYGRITAMLRYAAHVHPLFQAGPECFYPRPAVGSMVLGVDFNKTPEIRAENEAFLFKVIKAAFGQRRKTLKNALAGSELRLNPDFAQNMLELAGIDSQRRAETLTETEFAELSNVIGRHFHSEV